jgi:hypothetical protein
MDNTEIVKVENEPKPGSERFTAGYREAYDFNIKKWRMLPQRHCPLDINPFYNYIPKEPFTTSKQITHKGIEKEVKVDANGIKLTKDNRVNVKYYPPEKAVLFKYCTRLLAESNRANNRYEKMLNFINKCYSDDPDIKKLLKENGEPRTDTIIAYYTLLCQKVLALPEIRSKFFAQILEKAQKDPFLFLQTYQRLTGLPLQLFVNNNSEGGDIKLNIYTDDNKPT